MTATIVLILVFAAVAGSAIWAGYRWGRTSHHNEDLTSQAEAKADADNTKRRIANHEFLRLVRDKDDASSRNP